MLVSGAAPGSERKPSDAGHSLSEESAGKLGMVLNGLISGRCVSAGATGRGYAGGIAPRVTSSPPLGRKNGGRDGAGIDSGRATGSLPTGAPPRPSLPEAVHLTPSEGSSSSRSATGPILGLCRSTKPNGLPTV